MGTLKSELKKVVPAIVKATGRMCPAYQGSRHALLQPVDHEPLVGCQPRRFPSSNAVPAALHGYQVAPASCVSDRFAHTPRLLKRHQWIGRAMDQQEWRHPAVNMMHRRKPAQPRQQMPKWPFMWQTVQTTSTGHLLASWPVTQHLVHSLDASAQKFARCPG